jgi:hypothetical protein
VYCSEPDAEATGEEEVPAQHMDGYNENEWDNLDGPPSVTFHPMSYYECVDYYDEDMSLNSDEFGIHEDQYQTEIDHFI